MCATATSLSQMIVYRAMQGFCGGAMVPTVFPVVYTLFPPRQLAPLMVIISLILNLSSTLGPTIGGYLTDTYSWHWLFLVNIVPGIAVAIVVWLCIDIDKPDFSLLRYFDVVGLVLDGGVSWAASNTRSKKGRAGTGSTTTRSSPPSVVSGDRRPRCSSGACCLSPADRRSARLHQPQFRVGLVLYLRRRHRALRRHLSSIPLFLAAGARLQRLQIGETVVVAGLAQMALSPSRRKSLARKLDLRIMLAIGLALFAFSMYLTAGLTNQAGFDELFVPQAVRGFALMFCYLPANLIALGTVPARPAEERRRALQSDARSRRRASRSRRSARS